MDVFVTCWGEEFGLIERALSAACAMRGQHQTWLLDDGCDPALASLAKRLGAGYLTRSDRKDAKAGNVNAALLQTSGDIIVLFDVDHAPRPDFLQQTLPYFDDLTVGFVQVMPTFSNMAESWVARAAAETSLDFYNPISIGMDGLKSVTKMGSNALIRRTALAQIGGYRPGLAEDLATSAALHAAGWSSRYVAEPLAPGLAPSDLAAWFTQQFKWARGVFEVILTDCPRFFPRQTWGQRLAYAVRTTKYGIGPVVCIHLALTIATLFSNSAVTRAAFEHYLIHLLPLAILDGLIRQLALRRWHHASVSITSLWRAVILVYGTWPIYTAAWLMALVRLPLAFRPTPKNAMGRLHPLWLLPQVLTSLLLSIGLFYSLFKTDGNFYGFIYGFALLQIFPQIIILSQWFQTPSNRKEAEIGGRRLKIGEWGF